MAMEQPVDLLHNLGGRLSGLSRRKGNREPEGGRLTALEANPDKDVCGLLEGDVFDEETHHPLALPVRRSGVTPESGEVPSEGADPGDLLLAQFLLAGSGLSIAVLLGGGDTSAPPAPLPPPGIRNPGVPGMPRHVAPPGPA